MKKNILIGLIISLTVILCIIVVVSFTNQKENNSYEKEIISKTESYLSYYVGKFPKGNSEVQITLSELKESGYAPNIDINCDGYVLVKAKQVGFSYKAFVKCPDYVTPNYKELNN